MFPSNWKHIVFLDGLLHSEKFSNTSMMFCSCESFVVLAFHFGHIKNIREKWCFWRSALLPVRFHFYALKFCIEWSYCQTCWQVDAFFRHIRICCKFNCFHHIVQCESRYCMLDTRWRCISTSALQKNNVNIARFQENHFKINMFSSLSNTKLGKARNKTLCCCNQMSV